jgi:hypothetical protein
VCVLESVLLWRYSVLGACLLCSRVLAVLSTKKQQTFVLLRTPVMATTPQMPVGGVGASTLKGKSAALSSFARFLGHVRKYGTDWEQLAGSTLCERTIWLEFMHYLVNDDEGVTKGGTVVEYARKSIAVAKAKFGSQPAHAAFFKSIDDENKQSWLKGAIQQVYTAKFHDAVDTGEEVASQAPPIYNDDRRDITKMLRLKDTEESCRRAAAVQLLGVAAGRPGEVATFSFDLVNWDIIMHCGVATWRQVKTHKDKKVGLMVGADRLICVVNALAVAHARGCFKSDVHDSESLNHLFSDLAESKSASTVITNWLKAMADGSTNATYSQHQTKRLTKAAQAAGARVGCINEMAYNGVIAEFIAAVSGHDLENLSCLFHYINVTLPLLVPGLLVLCGFKPPKHGLGPGAVPASFDAVFAIGAADAAAIEDLADFMLILRPGFSTPTLLRDGNLRPLALAMAASLVQYYLPTVKAGEIPTVMAAMRVAMVKAKLAANPVEAHAKLAAWSPLVQERFDMDNLHLTGTAALGGQEAMLLALSRVVAQLDRLEVRLTEATGAATTEFAGLRSEFESFKGKLSSFGTALSSRGPSPMKRSREDAAFAFAAADADDDDDDEPAEPAEPAELVDVDVPAEPATPARPFFAQPPPLQPQMFLVPYVAAAATFTSMKGLTARACFMLTLDSELRPKASDVARCDTVTKCFKAVMTKAESAVVVASPNRDELAVAKLVSELHDRVLGRMLLAHSDATVDAGNVLTSWKELTANTLTDRITEMDKNIRTQTSWKTRMTLKLTETERANLPPRPASTNTKKKKKKKASSSSSSSS